MSAPLRDDTAAVRAGTWAGLATRRRLAAWGAIVVLAAAGGVGIKFGRHHVFPRRFAVVEPGQLYRSGYLEPWPLRRIIREHRLKTILTLMTDEPDTPQQQKEEAIAEQEGVQLIRIGMPGDGCGDFDLLDRAADVIANVWNRPLLVHCAAGVHRTGAAYATWRMKHCGWTVEQALAESERYGYPLAGKPDLCEHLRRYQVSRGLGRFTPPS